jgi:hypothetical protein
MLPGTLIAIAGLAYAMAPTAAHAAGRFDGRWLGLAPAAGDCGVMTVSLVVTDDRISGTVAGLHDTEAIVEPALVSTGGTAQFALAGGLGFSATVRFSGLAFTGNFLSHCGLRVVSGSRVE